MRFQRLGPVIAGKASRKRTDLGRFPPKSLINQKLGKKTSKGLRA
jgi:hypothetical protein